MSRFAPLLAAVVAAAATAHWLYAAGALPARLTDQEFWSLSQTMSEPSGDFHSDNFVSNENGFEVVIPDLVARVPSGGVYLGVGPEQNFTYIAALKPRMAFIVDIRRGNLHEHLLYKALFEMSADRVEFASRLFCRARPAGLSADASAGAIFSALASEQPAAANYDRNLASVLDWLKTRHGLTLPAEDLLGIGYVYHALFEGGPGIGYTLTGVRGRGVGSADYAHLMTATDDSGRQWSFLSSAERFQTVKWLEEANLIVPVVGNFAGPKAIRAVASYLKEHGAVVSAFYLSNVEQYLEQDGIRRPFCQNAAALPLTPASTFIRSVRGGFAGAPPPGGRGAGGRAAGPGFVSTLAPMQQDITSCAGGGR